MIVTKIERQKQHPQRLNIYLDNEFAFGLHEEILYKARIREGDTLDPPTIQIIQSREEFRLAKDKALRLIGQRLRSEKELRLYLTEKEFDPDIIDNVIYELQTKGFIDDRKFASAFVHDLQARTPAGKKMLVQKLRLRGIAPTIIDETLNLNLPDDHEAEIAYAAALNILKRYRMTTNSIPEHKQRQRMAQYLARHGFNWGIIGPVMKKLFSENIGAEG